MTKECLVIYEWDPLIEMADLFDVAMRFLEQRGYVLARGKMQADGRVRSAKASSVQTLRSLGPHLKFIEIELERREEVASLLVSKSNEHKRNMVVVAPQDATPLFGLFPDIAKLGELRYGIGYPWHRPDSPVLHAVGITHGVPRTEPARSSATTDSVWFAERIPMGKNAPRMRHLQGMVRDVYEENLISATHLEMSLGKSSLGSWIRESSVGTLEALGRNNFLWRLNRAKQRVVAREKLAASQLLIAPYAAPPP